MYTSPFIYPCCLSAGHRVSKTEDITSTSEFSSFLLLCLMTDWEDGRGKWGLLNLRLRRALYQGMYVLYWSLGIWTHLIRGERQSHISNIIIMNRITYICRSLVPIVQMVLEMMVFIRAVVERLSIIEKEGTEELIFNAMHGVLGLKTVPLIHVWWLQRTVSDLCLQKFRIGKAEQLENVKWHHGSWWAGSTQVLAGQADDLSSVPGGM